MLKDIKNALNYFYGDIKAEMYLDSVGSKNSKDLINLFETLKMSPKDERVNEIQVYFLMSLYFKEYTPIKYKNMKRELFKDLFFHKTTKQDILFVIKRFWEKETLRRKDKHLEVNLSKILPLFSPLGYIDIIDRLEATGSLHLFGNKLRLVIPSEYMIIDTEVALWVKFKKQ